ncbi:MAG: hypothetical protein BZY80_02480 [SAR202 cluster bacterium Io17-Chloro-G2]|nr:MAG: hypothetical protein BZY80_02480 [SAR202 cluster bacterium Io17-Chloro-G2]
MERELSLLKKNLDDSCRVRFQTLGIGPERAYQQLLSLLKPAPASNADRYGAVLLLGFAGAVDPSLKPADLILSSRYYRAGSNLAASSPDPGLADAECPSASIVRPDFLEPNPCLWQQAADTVQETPWRFTQSPSLTVDRVIDSPEDKRAIFDRYSVASVNMEDYSAASAAQEAGVPFLSVRAVLDVADRRLPGYLPTLSNSGISIPGSRAVLFTLSHPWRIPTLLALAVNMRRAQWALARFALAFIPKMADLYLAATQGSAPRAGNSSRLLQCMKYPGPNAVLSPGLIS